MDINFILLKLHSITILSFLPQITSYHMQAKLNHLINTKKDNMDVHHRVFQDDDEDRPRVVNVSEYNADVMKRMTQESPISVYFLIIIIFITCSLLFSDAMDNNSYFPNINPSTLVWAGANYSLLVNSGQYWRILCAIFLHAGLVHLFMNSISFLLYLMPVEKRTNHKGIYLAVLVWGGMLGNLLSLAVGQYRRKYVFSVGASTSICAVIGFDFAYRILRVNNQPMRGRRIIITLVYLFLLSMIPGIDFWGHFGSLFGGFFIGLSVLESGRILTMNARKMISYGGFVLLLVYTGYLVWSMIT